MKDGIVCGLVVGMIAGALLYKYNPNAKQIVDDTEKAVKNEMKNMQKPAKSEK